MSTDSEKPSNVPPESKFDFEQIKTDLVDFAVDREEIKFLLARWPDEAAIKAPKVDYELQILKIIAVGWSLTYYLQHHPAKEALQELFWQAVGEFAAGLSETTGLMIGRDIDYFAILKERLDHYLSAMGSQSGEVDPSQVVAPEFAGLCGDREDLFARMAGGKMFNNTLIRVKQYLEAVKLA
jgi:hypothetical protein